MRSMLSTGRVDVNTDMPKVSLGKIGKKAHVVSLLKCSPCVDMCDCTDQPHNMQEERLDLDGSTQQRLPSALVFDWLQLPKKQRLDSASTAVGDDTVSNSSSNDAPRSPARPETGENSNTLAEVHQRNVLLHDTVTSLRLTQQAAEEEVQQLLDKCQSAEREAKNSVQSLAVHTKAIAQLEKQRSSDQRKRRQQVAKVELLRERLATESRVRSQQAASIEQLSRQEVELSEKMEHTLRSAQQCKKRAKLEETVELHQLQKREQDMLTKLEEVNKSLQDAEVKKEQALHAANEAVVLANCKIETAKANLHSHIQMRSGEIANLVEQEQVLQERLKAEHTQFAAKEMLEATQLQKSEARNHRQASAVAKEARDLEQQRSRQQRKLDEQKRRQQLLQTKICEDVKVAAMQEVEQIKTQAEAEAATLRARAKAQLKASRQNASRLQAKMLAEARAEVAAMKEQAKRELQVNEEADGMEKQVHLNVLEAIYPVLTHEYSIADVETVDEEVEIVDEESGSDWELLHEVTTAVEATSIDEEFCWDIMG